MSNNEKGRREVGSLRIDTAFFDFVENELLPSIDLDPAGFWSVFEALIDELTPVNRELLRTRDELQEKIDEWHLAHPGRDYDHAEYVAFLKSIGYLLEPGDDFTIGTANVDAEIAEVAGPQLVVPVSNARFALNAANARWGSLYDALYGTDVISEDNGQQRESPYNPTRGCAVIRYARSFLDQAIPLDGASHADVSDYGIAGDEFMAVVDGKTVGLADPSAFRGHARDGEAATYLFVHNGLHLEIQTNPQHPIGREAAANVADVVLESAITTIEDCEDSVAAVDAEDKANVYRNWLGLMQGTLEATFAKGGETMTRRLNPDREYTGVDGKPIVLSGRSLMLVRNVGHLMTNSTILDRNGDEVFEGMMDAVVTTACALANRRVTDSRPNSR